MADTLDLFPPHRTGAPGSFPSDCLKRPRWAFVSTDGGGPLDAPETLPSGSVAHAAAWAAWFPSDAPRGDDSVRRA
jgi:hypothetical protein